MTVTASTGSDLVAEYQAFLDARPDLVENPFGLFAKIREQAPVFRHTDQFVVVGYEQLSKLLVDERFLVGTLGLKSSRMRAFMEKLTPEEQEKVRVTYDFKDRWLSFVNGEQHDRLRALAHRAFTPRVIGRMNQRVEEIANELLDAIVAKGAEEVDIVAEFAWQFPLIVISEMLDVPPEDRYDLRRWSHQIMSLAEGANPQAVDDAYQGVLNFERYLIALFERRRRETSTTDLMGALLAAHLEDGDAFSDRELVPVVAQFIFAGHETTTNLIANGLYAMLGAFRSQWDMLREDPDLSTRAADEALRYETSANESGRTAGEDCEFEGVEIKQWDSVAPRFAAANRDPAAFENPDVFDMHRKGPKHLGLGLGPHYCLGASLAKLEAATAFATVARRFPDAELRPGAVRTPNHRTRGFDVLPVSLGREVS
jgi:cytochrome P450